MAVYTITNNFGMENLNQDAALASDLVAHDLSEQSLMGAVVSQPDSELALNIDRPIVDSSIQPVTLDLNADSQVKDDVVSDNSDLSSVNSLIMAVSETSAPKTYVVTNNKAFGPGSLREAIKNANANDGADTIEISSDVTLTSMILINDDVTIKGNGHTITQTGSDRIFYIGDGDANNDINVSLRNLNLTGGSPVATGGAILSYENLSIRGGSFYDNATTLRGGAIYQEGGSLEVINARFLDNQIVDAEDVITNAGGAIYTKNTELYVSGSRFVNNSSKIGGGITAFENVEATIEDSLFRSNTGGGVGAYIDTNINIDSSTFMYNAKDISGGGLNLQENVTATVTNSTFEGNSAAYGGGIEVLDNSQLTLVDSVVTGNNAYYSGGGIDVYGNSTVEAINSTITYNSSDFGGGISSLSSSSVTLTDTVVESNAIDNLAGNGFTIVDTTDLNQDIFGDNQDNTLVGNALDNHIKGRGGRDTLLGGEGDDTLRGQGGHDVLSGDSGNDRLIGGNGNDTLIGGAGSDVLKGGAGRDLFVIGEGTNKILDFEVGTDTIGLSDGLSYEDLTAIGGTHTRLFAAGELVGIVRDVNPTELGSANFVQV